MNLKSLELQGFKSFPDRTLIRFGEEITAIVGPNGSGKSNISDALLWVMGEQSSRTLRGAKMEDVIFGGTQKRSAVGFAEATLTLDNSDRSLAWDSDEVVVTRRYYRSGEGEYYINKQSARLKDINELLMDTGLGREGYSNIGQGRIDEILSLKSGDRREIFEEAAGISKYRHRKEETERRLFQTEDNLLRIGDKVSELELQIAPLKTQAEKAQNYLVLKKELKGLEIAVWLDSLEKQSEIAKKATEDYASAAFVVQQAHEDLENLYASSDRLGELLRTKDNELDTVRNQLSVIQNTHQQLTGQIAVLKGNLENNTVTLDRISQEMASRNERSDSISAQIDSAKNHVFRLEQSRSDKYEQIQLLTTQLAVSSANAQGISSRFQELKKQEAELSVEIAGYLADIRASDDSLSQNEQRLAQLQVDLREGAQRKQDTQQELDDCRQELKKRQEEANASRNSIQGYRLRRESRARRLTDTAQKLREMHSKADSLEAKIKVFNAMEKDYENFQRSVRMVMQEADRGRLHHIHGPLSRLIKTDDEYTVAIEIAMGGAMQDIVVDNEQDAKAGIQYLKRASAGRATFLPLSGIRGGALNEPGLNQMRGFVGIASELVSFSPQYRNAVEFRLGKTVIAEDMDSAIAISKRFSSRFRIVTLDGQVINYGGSMTGGSTNKESGILSRANELERMTTESTELQKILAESDAEYNELKRQVDQADFEMAAMQDQLRQHEDQILMLQGKEQQILVLLDVISQAETSARKEFETLNSRMRSEGDRKSANAIASDIKNDLLRKIRSELDSLEGDQSKSAAASTSITEQLTQIRTDIAALDAERSAEESHIRDLEELKQALQGDSDRQQGLAEGIRKESEKLQADIAELLVSQQNNEHDADIMSDKVQKVIASRAETEAAKTRAEKDAQEKSKDILNMERAAALLEQKKLAAEMEERQIIDKLWDTYELTPGTAKEQRSAIESIAAGTRRIGELKRRISSLGTPNLGAIEEYARVSERYIYLTGQRDDVLTSKKELEGIIKDITKEMTGIFVEEFAKIDHYFGEVFEEMFGGGKGKLLLEDPENPLTCGIEIRVQPPGKQVKTITLLSGGEKAFVATALYFAILKVRPTPFCLLDEIDAALDDRNVERFAGYLHNLSQKTQFIVITHRRGTMEASNVLYGVTMQEQGVSKLLRLDLDQMTQMLGISD